MNRCQVAELLGVPFTPAQLDAITAPLEPGLVVAGAGSGKTTVMAARVVWLVGNGLVAPEQVLGLTFTNKAAAELAARVRSSLRRARGDRPAPADEDEPIISTYHAYAGRLLAEHGLRVGVEPRARLLADATRYQLAARVLRRYDGPLAALTGNVTSLAGKLVQLEAELNEHLVAPAAVQAADAELVAAVERACAEYEPLKGTVGHCKELRKLAETARARQELVELVLEYRAAKRAAESVDFGDQVAVAAALAQLPEVGEAERQRARVVLLDEYQDTSVAQRVLLTGLFAAPGAPGHPVTAVGDPCQAIYGWRGASVANLDDFPEHFRTRDGRPAARYQLVVNQRSGGRLLALANRVAATLHRRHRVEQLRAPELKVDAGELVVALHHTWADEVQWLAEQLKANLAEPDPGDPAKPRFAARQCAVLVRQRSDFADLHAALRELSIPVEVVGLGGLLTLPEVADVVATLQVVDDPTANAAIVRLLSGPRWRLGPRELARLGRRARELVQLPGAADARDPDPLVDATVGRDPCDLVSLADAVEDPGSSGWSPEALARLRAFAAELAELRAARAEPLLELVHRVLRLTGLDVEVVASPAAAKNRRRENLGEFLDLVAGFSDIDGSASLTAFLAFLAAAQAHEHGLDNTVGAGHADAVQLLTVHKAKGLEWDVVFCPDLTHKVFPNERAADSWATKAEVLPGRLRGDADTQPVLRGYAKADLASFKDQRDELQAVEERRLAYVAFTRARHRLVASGHWWGPSQKKARGPSVLLTELREHVDAEGHGTVPVWAPLPADEEKNPLLERLTEQAWPAAFAPEPAAARLRAAAAVRAALDSGAAADVAGLSPGQLALFAQLDQETAWLLDEELRLRSTVREVELPGTLSTTQLMRLRTDPDGLAAELARPVPRRPAPAARRGTRFHAWVESLFGEPALLGPDELPGAEDDALVDERELASLQEAFLAGPYGNRPPYAVEAPFVLPLAGRLVRGRIDAVYRQPDGGFEVVDWKTGREVADPVQLAVYRLAWAQLAGVPTDLVSAAFYYVASGKVVRPALPTRGELAAALGAKLGDNAA